LRVFQAENLDAQHLVAGFQFPRLIQEPKNDQSSITCITFDPQKDFCAESYTIFRPLK
jgi:hypothetical protein